MFEFVPNLSTIFTEVPFINRFKMAKKAGFKQIEFQFPYGSSAHDIKEKVGENDLQTVLFNLPAGNWEEGDRGIAIFENRREEFRESVLTAIEYAQALNCSTLHCMAGVLPDELTKEDALQVYKENLKFCAQQFENYEMTVLIEPINTMDIPGYFLSDVQLAVNVIDDLALPNIKLQYDFYHMQRMQGELIRTFQQYKDYIAHIQIADNPGRHEPGTGEIHYENIFRVLKDEGYAGFVGLEYNPKGKSEESFTWLNNGQDVKR